MQKKSVRVILTLTIMFIIAFLAGIAFGSVKLGLKEVLSGLLGMDETSSVIITKLRLPRVLGALLSGIALSVSGLLLQSATDNDLCSPNVIGVNAGAGFFVMLVLCFLPSAFYITPLFAFAGAMMTTFLVLGISGVVSVHQNKVTIILSGVAISALMNAGISFLSQRYPDVLPSYTSFSIGGFSGVHMKDLWIPFGIIVIGVVLSFMMAPKLNLLCLGDELAHNAGVNVKVIRVLSLIVSSALAAASVSYAGLIGFVGLMVPHMARKLVGHDVKRLVVVSSLLGAILVILADLIGRTAFAPGEVSAGVFLNLLGAPFFIFLLIRRRIQHD